MPYILLVRSGLAGGQIAGLVTISIEFVIIFTAFRSKVPYTIILLALVAFFFLQPVKGHFRAIAWKSDIQMGSMEKLKLFIDMGVDHYFGTSSMFAKTDTEESLHKAFNRIYHLHLTSCVIAHTPSKVPFQYGNTYVPLFTKFIPRFLWPGKPVEDLGNRWAKWYGYLNPSDNITSLNLPWLTEMFLNFGWFGVIAINILLGLLFAFLRPFWQNPVEAGAFSFGLVLGMPLTIVESNLSMKLGKLIIGLPILFALLWGLSILFPAVVRLNKVQRKRV